MKDFRPFMKELGEFIRIHRRRAGLTQIQLADLAGIGKATVYSIEKGRTTFQIDSLLAVLTMLNIDIRFYSPLGATFSEMSANGASAVGGALSDRE